jgi:hypothetical protein
LDRPFALGLDAFEGGFIAVVSPAHAQYDAVAQKLIGGGIEIGIYVGAHPEGAQRVLIGCSALEFGGLEFKGLAE